MFTITQKPHTLSKLFQILNTHMEKIFLVIKYINDKSVQTHVVCMYVGGRCRYGRKTIIFLNSHNTCIKYQNICTKGPLGRYTKSTTIWSKVLVLLFVKLRSFCYAMCKVSRNWRSSHVKFAKKCGLTRNFYTKLLSSFFQVCSISALRISPRNVGKELCRLFCEKNM